MKKILIFALAAAAMVSCSTDEVVDIKKEAIGFDKLFVDNSTRAIDGSFSSTNMPKSFQVYGITKGDETNAPEVPIFNNVKVENTSEGWKYADQYTQYWIDGNTYNFAAVVNGAISADTTIAYIADGTTDLLYAKNNYDKYTKGKETTVPFTFKHLLSKVQFTVKNNMAAQIEGNVYTYKVTDVKITNAYLAGSYDITKFGTTAVGWTVSGDPGVVAFGNVSNATDAEDAAEAVAIGTWKESADATVEGIASATSHYSRLLIPADYSALNITCTITTYLNDSAVDVEKYNKNIDITLVEGNAYNFIIEKGVPGEQILFSVDKLNDWGNNDQTL